jgi:hypothetical protein
VDSWGLGSEIELLPEGRSPLAVGDCVVPFAVAFTPGARLQRARRGRRLAITPSEALRDPYQLRVSLETGVFCEEQ